MSTFKNIYHVILLSIFFCYAPLIAATTPLSFQYLSQTEYNHDLSAIMDKFASINNQNVEIRGFLYQNPSGNWILSSDPNLATCCVGSQEKVFYQIAIKGDIAENTSPATAVTIQGQFTISPERNEKGEFTQLYVIQDPKLVTEDFLRWFSVTLAIVGIGIGAIFLCRLMRKSKGQLNKFMSSFRR